MSPLRRFGAVLFLASVLSACSAAGLQAEGLTGRVGWIYDGDTLKVETVGKVRLLGIDTPETEDSDRDNYYLRRGLTRARLRQVADAARQRVIELAKGRRVILEVGGDGRDRHGRLLAYVYLPDGRLLNRLLLEEGLASVYRIFSFSRKAEFLAAEAVARKQMRGLWSEANR